MYIPKYLLCLGIKQTIKYKNSSLLNIALEPLYIYKEEGVVNYFIN
jgi:hypothetical protein